MKNQNKSGKIIIIQTDQDDTERGIAINAHELSEDFLDIIEQSGYDDFVASPDSLDDRLKAIPGLEVDVVKQRLFKRWELVHKRSFKGKGVFRVPGIEGIVERSQEILKSRKFPKNTVLIFDTPEIVLQSNKLADLIFETQVSISSLVHASITHSYGSRLHHLSQIKSNHSNFPHVVRINNANDYALKVGKILLKFHKQGKLTLKEKAKSLKEAKIETPRGQLNWDTSGVRNIWNRWQELTGNKFDVVKPHTKKSEQFALEIGPILDEIEKNGITSFRAKASELTKRKIKNYRGNDVWHPSNVMSVQKRYEELKNK